MKHPMKTRIQQAMLLLCTLFLSACITGPTANTLYTLQPARQDRLGKEFNGFKEMILIMPVRNCKVVAWSANARPPNPRLRLTISGLVRWISRSPKPSSAI
jgi:ABC-type uncharacterized transport system auxiliary subunit